MSTEGSSGTTSFEQGSIRGFLQMPESTPRYGMVLTHGAGSNSDSPLLKAVATAFAAEGYAVLRYDLPFRQRRRTGPPHPSVAAQDRAGLLEAATALHDFIQQPVLLAGHSYGGRQASILAVEHPKCCLGLLLLSYPLHPPEKPLQLRTAHFTHLQTPALFVHGALDPFGTEAEMRTAIATIPSHPELQMIEGVGHDLGKGRLDWAASAVRPFTQLLTQHKSQ